MAGIRIKNIMCPTCKEVTEHRPTIDQPGMIRWVVSTCVVCGSQWRVPVDQPAPYDDDPAVANTGHEDYSYE